MRAASDRRSLLILASLVGSAVLGGGVLWWRLRNDARAAAVAQPVPAEAPPPAVSPASAEVNQAVPAANTAPPAATAASSALDAHEELERLRLLPNDEYLKLWSSLYPYLVELEVHTVGEPRRVAGVIVDSRGWVLTSLAALRGARRVQVRTAAKTFNAARSTGELVDDARGVLDLDPTHDLVLLEINRRLVTAFANLTLEVERGPVGGESLIGAVPPPAGEQIWFFDCAIRQVEPREKLPAAIQARLPATTEQSSDNPVWMVCSGPPPRVGPGTPLFTPLGRLAGILTGGSTGAEGIGATAEVVAAFCHREHGPARSFAAAWSPTNDAAPESPPPPDSDPRLAGLASRITAVEQAGVFQDRPGAFEALHQFAEDLLAMDQAFEALPVDDEVRPALERLLDRFQKIVFEGWGIGQFTIDKFNQRAWDQSATDASPLVAVATVYQAGLTAPKINGSETVIFRLEPAEQYLITPVAEHLDLFLPGTRWLIVGVSRAGTPDYKATKPTPFAARRCKIIRVFALNEAE